MNNLGNLLAWLGRWQEAVEPAGQAVGLYRSLAATNPAGYQSEFAAALNNLGNLLAGLGRWQEAMESTEESVAVRRRLAEANPVDYLPDLARGLWGFAGVRVAAALRLNEALVAIEESVRIYQGLAEHLREALVADLRGSLGMQAEVLDALGRAREADEIRSVLRYPEPDEPK